MTLISLALAGAAVACLMVIRRRKDNHSGDGSYGGSSSSHWHCNDNDGGYSDGDCGGDGGD